ncbi:MAG TPA: nicotinate (nicotinamide) nucleotide adenylyltransferase [Verrucomicrobiales bacterium]|nr:nicotinate (nicotinamide) nucleotide adenylyltransferase [Verrucomicrobiales bacterium]
MKRIGIYGGSFDPVHHGHLLVAQAALEELSLDRLVFVPAARSPFKPDADPAPATERVRLLRLALAGEPRCSVDLLELDRGGVSFTVETLRTIRARHPDATLFYLVGDDHVATLPKWKDADELATLAEFAVIPRPGVQPAVLPEPFRGHRLCGFPLGVSSSQIRERVRRGLPLRGLVPAAVAEAIANNRLYLSRGVPHSPAR